MVLRRTHLVERRSTYESLPWSGCQDDVTSTTEERTWGYLLERERKRVAKHNAEKAKKGNSVAHEGIQQWVWNLLQREKIEAARKYSSILKQVLLSTASNGVWPGYTGVGV